MTEKEKRELGFLFLGILYGLLLGIAGNLWSEFFIETLRSFRTDFGIYAVPLSFIVLTVFLRVHIL